MTSTLDSTRNGTSGGHRTPAAVELRGVGKSFGRGAEPVWALRDVNLRVDPGEFVVLLGASGAARARCSTWWPGWTCRPRGR